MHKLYPYYYPTTTVFVDDNRNFLANLSLQLDSALAYRLYDSPHAALDFVTEQAQLVPDVRRFFSRLFDCRGCSHADYAIHLNVVRFVGEIENRRRFSEVSVAVVDYDMNGINGLDLCAKFRELGVKTVLLTGVADEKEAVRAFNDGTIDYFVPKSASDVGSVLDRVIQKLQGQYFSEGSSLLITALELAEIGLFRDPIFAEFFHGILKQHRFVEYYVLPGGRGFLLLDAKGNPSVLLLQTEEQMVLHYEIALEEEAPATFTAGIGARAVVPYCCSNDGYFRPEARIFTYEANKLKAARDYYWALVDRPPFIDFSVGQPLGYEAYLRKLDTPRLTPTNGDY